MKRCLLSALAVGLCLSANVMAQVPSYVPTSGLVGYWPFNGNANDESGNGNNGTVNGATLTNDRNGNMNSAYSFDGVDDKIPTSIMPSLNDLSFNVFFQIQSTNGNYKRLVDIDNASQSYFDLNVAPDNTATAQFRVNNIQYNFASTTQLNDTNWHCITFARNNDFGYFYLDGILADSQFIANSPFYANALLTFGHTDLGGYPEQFFYGKIDDIGIWNRALTQEEITNLYNGCSASTITTQPTNQTVNPTTSAQFIVNATSGSLFQWQTDLGLGFQNMSNAGQYSGANNDTLVVSNSSTSNNNQQFRCIVNPGSCADTSDIAVLSVSTVGMNELSVQGNVSLYPNPTQSSFEIQTNLVYSKVEIRDMQGRIVKTENAGKTITIASLQKGTYLVQLLDDKSKVLAVQQIIKE